MKITEIIIVLSILFLGLLLRLNNYEKYPQRGATSDEYTYSFLGVSLLTKGIPISWSHFDYPNKKIVIIDNIVFPIVSPYFDHPPLYGLIVGGWAILNGQNTFEKIELKTIRIIPIFFGAVSSLLVYLIAERLYGFKIAIWSLLIFSTTTVYVMNMRIVISETLTTPLLLSSVYIFSKYPKVTNKKAIILGLLSGMGIMTKIFGMIIFLNTFANLIIEKAKPRVILFATLIFLSFVIALVAYGRYYDLNLFFEIQKAQSSRNIGPDSLWLFTLSSTIVNKVFQDGWYFFGLFALFYLFSDFAKHKLIILPSLIYILILISSLNRTGHSGWYMIPLFPFMSIATAYVLDKAIKSSQYIFFIFLLMIGLTEIKLIYEEWFGLNNFVYRLLLIFVFAPFVFAVILKRFGLFSTLANMWIYIFILGSIILTHNYVHPA